MTQTRHLAAIMFTDIVGYTALMGNDERKAFELLTKNRQIQKPIIEKYNGKWIKELGDGVMASFNTASDAVNAAMKIQEACNASRNFQLKIGIHLGEVVFENEDVYGDGVNIASRIETLGVGSSVLLSKSIRDQVKNNAEFQIISLGSFEFKNVGEAIEVFARSATFKLADSSKNISSLKKLLKADVVLTGQLRQKGGVYYLSCQLVDAANQNQIWGNKYEMTGDDISQVEDSIITSLMNPLRIILLDKSKGIQQNRRENPQAYAEYLKGRYLSYGSTP